MTLIFGGCTIQSFRDPCFFDPPPGDQFTRAITNDSARSVALVDCDDERCRRGYNLTKVSSGASADMIVEACSVETFAVTDLQTHEVRGCLHEPGDELKPPEASVGRRVSQQDPCVGSPGHPFKITIYDPSK